MISPRTVLFSDILSCSHFGSLFSGNDLPIVRLRKHNSHAFWGIASTHAMMEDVPDA